MRKHELNLDLVRNAHLGRINKVKEALQAGADVNAIGEDGYTALMLAVLYCHEDVVEYLLANGADINLQQHLGSTVLMGAQTKSMVELLARNGADPFLLSNEQQSPFDLMLTNKLMKLYMLISIVDYLFLLFIRRRRKPLCKNVI